MQNDTPQVTDLFRKVLEIGLRLAIIVILASWAFTIVRPFIELLAWGGIIAVALYPLCTLLAVRIGDRSTASAWLLAGTLVAILIVPTIFLSISGVDAAREVAQKWEAGTLEVVAPTERVKSWPLVGERVYDAWAQASVNLEAFAKKFEPQIRELGKKSLVAIASVGALILKFTFSILIAGAFMANAPAIEAFFLGLSRRLASDDGERLITLSVATIRSVAQGILGIAMIQALASAAGLVLMGIPLAGLWATIVLFLAIVQLPPLLLLGPIAVYSFSAYDTVPAVIFSVFMLIVSVSDGFLKPMLLGRGVDVPMLVILLGAIGGMLASGVIGLFVGAVILALIYRLFTAWLESQADDAFSFTRPVEEQEHGDDGDS
jgi:predicted PurR-regulated permease PerM